MIRDVRIGDSTVAGDVTINGTCYFATADAEDKAIDAAEQAIRKHFRRVWERYPEAELTLGDSHVSGDKTDNYQFVDYIIEMPDGIGILMCPHCGEPHLHYWELEQENFGGD